MSRRRHPPPPANSPAPRSRLWCFTATSASPRSAVVSNNAPISSIDCRGKPLGVTRGSYVWQRWSAGRKGQLFEEAAVAASLVADTLSNAERALLTPP